MAVLGISSYVSTKYLAELASSDGTSLNNASTTTLVGSSGVKTALSGIKRGVSAFNQAIQGINIAITYVNVTGDALKNLAGITSEMIEVTEKATQSGIGAAQRSGYNSDLKQLIDKFQRVARDSFGTSLSYDPMKSAEYEKLFRAVGLDKSRAADLAEILKRMKTAYDSDGNLSLVSDKSQAPRPIRIPQSAYQRLQTTFSPEGSGSFSQVKTFTQGGSNGYKDIELKDVNNDGKQDIVSLYGSRIGVVQMGNGDGTFDVGKSYNFATGGSGSDLSIQDLNGDNNLDVMHASSGRAYVSLANANGSYNAPISYVMNPVAASGGHITSGVVDQTDAVIDIVGSNGTSVYVLTGNAGGTFDAPMAFTGGGSTVLSLALGSVDNLAGNDVVTVTTSSVNILSGNSDGSLSAPVSYAISATTVNAFSLTDLDGDTDLDIAVTDSSTGKVQVLLNNGDGTFLAQVTFAAGTASGGASSVTTADINGDGDQDLVVTNPGDLTMSTLLGNGNGTFQAPISSRLWSAGSVVAVAQVDGDSRYDAVVGVGSLDRSMYMEGLQSTTTTTTSSVTSKNYSLLFSADRTIRTRPEAYQMLADLKALGEQLATNIKTIDESFNYLANNVYMLRSVGLVFSEVAKTAQAKTPRDAEEITQAIVSGLRGMSAEQVKQLHNLEAISVAALNSSYLDNVKAGIVTL